MRRPAMVLAVGAMLALFLGLLLPSTTGAAGEGACANSLYQPSGQSFWVAAPASSNANGPVVVFVHGYTSDHGTWTGSNYAVQHACEQGYRVAAVDLGPESSIWSNGAQLTGLLQQITAYYNVSQVSVMAHSKGGLDTQTAIVHYGAWPYVKNYVAFGSPFGGTDLADHACSWYGFWLWQCNDATYTMQTGYMSYVRSITDGRPENDTVAAFAARGSKCLWYNPACVLISGPDDGVVPTWSVWANGEDTHISDRSDLTHFAVHQTQNYNRSWLFSYLNAAPRSSNNRLAAPTAYPSSSHTLRAGALDGKVAESVPVESGLKGVSFDLLTHGPAAVSVIAPSGTRYAAEAIPSSEGDILRGTHYRVTVERPEAGLWTVSASASAPGSGYLLTVSYEGGLTVTLPTNVAVVHRPSEAIALGLRSSRPVNDPRITILLRDGAHNVVATANSEGALPLPAQSGVYTVEATLQGTLADGSAVERTLVSSIAVVAEGESLR